MKANDIQIILRQEREEDYKQTEFVTREAFWNYYAPKFYEHYLLHIMREVRALLRNWILWLRSGEM